MPEHLNKPEETGEMTQQAYNEIVKVRHEKLKALRDAGKDPFVITKYPQTDYSATAKAGFTDVPEGQLGKAVCMAGRMMSKRVMGKASFAHLRDNEGDIQIYVRRDDVGDGAYADFKKFDIGDIIGVKGNLFRTKMGEISVHATEVTLLSKSLLPLPEKFHGLRDTELRFRQRYVDLIMNPEVRRTFEVRSKFIKFMRKYLDDMGYMEVETPVLNTISGGATARPFITHHNTLNLDMYMRIATELPLKRLIVGGPRVRNWPHLPQRGYGPQAQPRVHHHRAVSGLCRFPRHDGYCRGHHLWRSQRNFGHL